MTEIPKIVHHRLRASAPAQEMLGRAHPEADLLSAFSEQTVSAAEREGILQHLALCADCRDVVALALPNTDVTVAPAEPGREAARTPPPVKARTNWFGWASLHRGHLRWAALAAGIAVVLLVAHPEWERLSKPTHAVKSVATLPPATEQPRASTSTGASALMVEESKGGKPLAAEAATARTQLDTLSNKPKAAAAPAPQPETPTMFASNLGKKSASASSLAASNMYDTRASIDSRAGTGGEAKRAAPVPHAESAADGNLLAQAEAPPIEKAKPALKESAPSNESQKTELQKEMVATPQAPSPANSRMVARGAAAPVVIPSKQHATWTIAAGVLQRSLDNGQSWQTAARSEHALLCFANRDQEVWAGGHAGILLHTIDGGTTWRTIVVSFKDQPLSSDVTHIDLENPAEIVLSTVNHETWSSVDGGKTWEKK